MFLLPKMPVGCQEYVQVAPIVASSMIETISRRNIFHITCSMTVCSFVFAYVCACVCVCVHLKVNNNDILNPRNREVIKLSQMYHNTVNIIKWFSLLVILLTSVCVHLLFNSNSSAP